MEIKIENLKAQMTGRKLNIYQKADALVEFNKLIEHTEKLEQQVKNNVVLPDVSERYFVVAYVASNTKGHVTGFVDITTSGEYLNRALTIENIKEKLEVTDVVPTNIIEMNKVDFDSWRNAL